MIHYIVFISTLLLVLRLLEFKPIRRFLRACVQAFFPAKIITRWVEDQEAALARERARVEAIYAVSRKKTCGETRK